MVWIAGVAAREVSAKKLLWGAHAVRAVFPTSNERKEARAAREPHNDSVSDELLWGAHAVRAVSLSAASP